MKDFIGITTFKYHFSKLWRTVKMIGWLSQKIKIAVKWADFDMDLINYGDSLFWKNVDSEELDKTHKIWIWETPSPWA